MEGKIDKKGNLWIKRKSKWKLQFHSCEEVPCGDWCPLFWEPGELVPTAPGLTLLKICNDRILTFTKFTDERE